MPGSAQWHTSGYSMLDTLRKEPTHDTAIMRRGPALTIWHRYLHSQHAYTTFKEFAIIRVMLHYGMASLAVVNRILWWRQASIRRTTIGSHKQQVGQE